MVRTIANTPPATPSSSDATLLEETLETVAGRCNDLTPEVYRRFFVRCPSATGLFTIIDADTPPMGCGQMLFEILSLLRDNAEGKGYIPDYMKQIASEHAAFQVSERQLYADFLNALTDTLSTLMGNDWRPAHEQAWQRQITTLLSYLPQGNEGESMKTPYSCREQPGHS